MPLIDRVLISLSQILCDSSSAVHLLIVFPWPIWHADNASFADREAKVFLPYDVSSFCPCGRSRSVVMVATDNAMFYYSCICRYLLRMADGHCGVVLNLGKNVVQCSRQRCHHKACIPPPFTVLSDTVRCFKTTRLVPSCHKSRNLHV